MVDAHPSLAVIHETHWIPRFYEERIGLTPGGMVTTELVGKLLDDRRFGKLGIAREDLEGLIPRGAGLLRGLRHTYLRPVRRSQGQAVGREKTPSYVRNLPTLHRLWPTARFVHLIRDGRDVFLSMINWKRANRAVGARCLDPRSGRPRPSGGSGTSGWAVKRRPGWVRTCIAKCATKRWSLTPPGNTKLCTFLGLSRRYHAEFHEGRTKTETPAWTRSGRSCPSPVG